MTSVTLPGALDASSPDTNTPQLARDSRLLACVAGTSPALHAHVTALGYLPTGVWIGGSVMLAREDHTAPSPLGDEGLAVHSLCDALRVIWELSGWG